MADDPERSPELERDLRKALQAAMGCDHGAPGMSADEYLRPRMSDAPSVEEILKGGAALAAAVDARFKTRAAFGRAAGLRPWDVSRFCKGQRAPPPASIPGICAALAIPEHDVPPPRSPSELGLERRIAYLSSDLQLERATNADLRAKNRIFRDENKRLRSILQSVREAAGSA